MFLKRKKLPEQSAHLAKTLCKTVETWTRDERKKEWCETGEKRKNCLRKRKSRNKTWRKRAKQDRQRVFSVSFAKIFQRPSTVRATLNRLWCPSTATVAHSRAKQYGRWNSRCFSARFKKFLKRVEWGRVITNTYYPKPSVSALWPFWFIYLFFVSLRLKVEFKLYKRRGDMNKRKKEKKKRTETSPANIFLCLMDAKNSNK